jgi:hypothetical protein
MRKRRQHPALLKNTFTWKAYRVEAPELGETICIFSISRDGAEFAARITFGSRKEPYRGRLIVTLDPNGVALYDRQGKIKNRPHSVRGGPG